MIVLFGAEVAVADENSETYGFHPDFEHLSFATKKLLALKVLHLLVKRFVQGEGPVSVTEISSELEIPVRFVTRFLSELINARLVIETARNGSVALYQPAQPTEKITIQSALEDYERQGHNPACLATAADQKIAFYIKEIADEIAKSSNNILIKEI